MSPLETRRQLLISESEVNRVLLLRDGGVLTEGVHRVTHRAKQWGLIASSLLLVVKGFSSAGKHRESAEKRTPTPTLLAALLDAAAVLFTIWPKPQ